MAGVTRKRKVKSLNLQDMEEKIKAMLDEYGLTADQLTENEIERLKEEIKAKEAGNTVLDSVLDNPELFYRKK